MKGALEFIIPMAILCPLLHFVAFIIVAPVADIYEKKRANISEASKFTYIAIWFVACISTGIIAQFFVNLASAGLLMGAIINVSIALFYLNKRMDAIGGIKTWVAIYFTPLSGYWLGYYASNNMAT